MLRSVIIVSCCALLAWFFGCIVTYRIGKRTLAIIMNEKSVLDLGVEFTCDRPYAMAIVNSETGAVLFVSVVNDIPTIG